MLNTATRVEIAFGAERRRIDLRNGEIMLATARDPLQRPFVVDTADGTLTPIGTRFTVRSGDFAEDGTRVAVLDGAVEVRTRDNASTPLVVRAGEQRMFTHSAIQAVAALADNAVSWTQGSLGAERTRLADFLAELGRYRRGHLGCDPDVADLRLTGAFPLDDTDRILAALEDALPVKVRYLTRYWVTLTRAG
jgi:transmembrane sensor